MKNRPNIDLNHLRDYYRDRLDPSEEEAVRTWLSDHGETPEADSMLASLLDETSVEDSAQAQAAFERFCRRIGQPVPRRNRLSAVVRWSQRIAAILFVPLIVALSILWLRPDAVPEWQELAVPNGQRQELTLSDGTVLWLNAGTRITYPSRFEGPQRKIFVDGELYADVARDTDHPFVISAGEVDVRVLGTEFNLRAYRSDPLVEVSLVEGSVRFEVESERCREQVVMSPNEVVRYDRLSGTLRKNTFRGEEYTAVSRGGGFRFLNETLESIAQQLSRTFDCRIIIADPELSEVRFYAFFTNRESLDEILSTLNADGTMRIERHGQVIRISKCQQ